MDRLTERIKALPPDRQEALGDYLVESEAEESKGAPRYEEWDDDVEADEEIFSKIRKEMEAKRLQQTEEAAQELASQDDLTNNECNWEDDPRR